MYMVLTCTLLQAIERDTQLDARAKAALEAQAVAQQRMSEAAAKEAALSHEAGQLIAQRTQLEAQREEVSTILHGSYAFAFC